MPVALEEVCQLLDKRLSFRGSAQKFEGCFRIVIEEHVLQIGGLDSLCHLPEGGSYLCAVHSGSACDKVLRQFFFFCPPFHYACEQAVYQPGWSADTYICG